ncbi:efflux RND transporter permease subunit [Pelovirga terrestris]|uniref:Efflux RND transporter permease subunit n=1 Tax=Pelovirga terrestris TaxID=2771352 RepID=A0A8J6QN56_9BACT|nr:efflux RND transporter permease subunit [Pelovirga terrestris]MBD1399236.1 efflux RND transporter permease subunit [Pelovirga terrestris]
MLITDASVNRRSTIFSLMLIIVIAGIYSYLALPRESTPDVTVPYVLVVTPYEGVAPVDIESLITHPIERKLKGLKDVDNIRSVSAEGSSMIIIEFMPDVDIDLALQWVRDKVDQAKGDLPRNLENDPIVQEINLSEFPILMVSVAGIADETVLKKVGEELQDWIQTIPGVLDVVLSGGREREIRVEFDPDRMFGYEISLAEVIRAVARENVNIPGGSIDIGEAKYLLRIPGEFTDPNEIDNLVLTRRGGRIIYFKDVADVVDAFEDRSSYSRLNGDQSVTLAIKKRTGANIIDVADRVFALLAEAEPMLPPGVELAVTFNQSDDIRNMVRDLENNIITGLILVVSVLFLFLGFRNSFFVGLAIPFTMLIAFAVLYLLDITLNMVVLFSLILALGMLVDNAIVIVENIYRHMQSGTSGEQASKIAVSEVGWPVISSTVTTLCAFFPLLFWPGIMGEFMAFLPKTLIITLLASLFVALVINPTICAHIMKISPDRRLKDKKLPLILKAYAWSLEFALRHRLLVVLASLLMLVGITTLYIMFDHGIELFPDTEPNRAFVEIEAPVGTNLDTSDLLARTVEAIALAEPDINFVITDVGTTNSDDGGGGSVLSNLSKISLEFVDRHERKALAIDVLERIRQAVASIPGAHFVVEQQQQGPPTGPPVNIEVSGEDIDVIEGLVKEIRQRIVSVPGLVDLQDDLARAQPEIRIVVDREKASLLQLSTSDISEMAKAAISGTKLGVFREGEDEYDIVARFPPARRQYLADIENLLIPAETGIPVPLSTVAHVETGVGFGSIRHLDLKRVATLSAETYGRNSNEVLMEIQGRLADLRLPNGYLIAYSGEQEEQNKATSFLSKAFIGAVLLIMLVLVTQFNSLLQALIVMTTVVLSLTGVFLGLLITAKPFGIIMTGIGAISLAGVVVNNAIVLIDYTNQLMRSGMDTFAAIMRAGMVRFRPVLLTAATTILGLLPMALGVSFDFHTFGWEIGGESSEWWGPMAVAVIFGLAFATLLTLIVVPVLYSLADSLRNRFWSTKNV